MLFKKLKNDEENKLFRKIFFFKIGFVILMYYILINKLELIYILVGFDKNWRF